MCCTMHITTIVTMSRKKQTVLTRTNVFSEDDYVYIFFSFHVTSLCSLTELLNTTSISI